MALAGLPTIELRFNRIIGLGQVHQERTAPI